MSTMDLIALGALDDELGYDDELGAVARRRSAQRRAGISRPPLAAMRRALVPNLPGVPAVGGREEPVGFGSFTFGNATAQTVTLTARPQKPFKGRRLVIPIFRTAGAAAIGVNVTALSVGQANQLVSSGAVPADAFVPGAFGVDLNLDPATPGIDITIVLATTATPGAGETITVTPMLIGVTFG